jgi:hypothetical protein
MHWTETLVHSSFMHCALAVTEGAEPAPCLLSQGPLTGAPGQGPASGDSVSLVLGSRKGSIIRGLLGDNRLWLQPPAPFIWQQ